MTCHRKTRMAQGTRVGLLAIWLVLAVVGCRHTFRGSPVPSAMTAHCAPNFSAMPPRRVILLPVDNQTPYPAAAARFQSLLASELRSARLFELVTLDPCDPQVAPADCYVRDGRFPESLLALLRERYHVDGALFASLKELYPYWPPRFSAALWLADTRSGEVIASVDGAWDARDSHISYQARQYFQSLSLRESLTDDDLVLQSPELMGKFVAHELVSSLARCGGLCATGVPAAAPDSEREPDEEPLPAGSAQADHLAPVVSAPQQPVPETLPSPTAF